MHAYIACGVLRNISPEMVFSRLQAGGDTMVPQWLAVLILLFLSPSPLSGISEFCIILRAVPTHRASPDALINFTSVKGHLRIFCLKEVSLDF